VLGLRSLLGHSQQDTISILWAVERVLASNCTFAKIYLLLMGE